MRYYYKCKKTDENGCKLSDLPDEFYEGRMKVEVALDSRSMKKNEEGRIDPSSSLIWTVNHPMIECPEIKCPLCGDKATRIIGNSTEFYFRGNKYLDKLGCQRDMNLHKLQRDDPYGYMREPGEKDHLVDKLRKGGRHDPKPQYFRTANKDFPSKPCTT